MKAHSYLGILDWGIGGLGIYSLAGRQIPGLSVIYFSDTAVTPYGKMSRSELVSRLNIVIAYLHSQGVTHVLVGCNAASTVLPLLSANGITIKGVIEPAVGMTARLQPARLGLIGGRRTVLSGVYRRGLAKRGIKVRQRIAQPLSALIESGDVGSHRLAEECRRILAPIKKSSHLLLACTH